ncbi:hypothetical protein HDU93_007594 [Gonapodya sp. JEL0774]|nr:hypothetical protein HDU93_007594 [Gonapodya sp. JEL0774]
METLILGEMRRLVGGIDSGVRPTTEGLARRRKQMEAIARPYPAGALVSHVRIPRRPDLFYASNTDVTSPSDSDSVLCEVVEWRTSETSSPSLTKKPVVLYVHGGAWVMGSPKTHRTFLWKIAKATGCRVVALDYALAPESPYPAALIDVLSAYLTLTSQLPVTPSAPPSTALPTTLFVPPTQLVIAGDSAGGNLTLALLSWLRDRSYKQPAGAALLSPATELTFSNPDYQLNRFDYLPWAPFKIVTVPETTGATTPRDQSPTAGSSTSTTSTQESSSPSLEESSPDEDQVHLYCSNHEIFTPYVSPMLYSSCDEYPPVLVQVGDAERLWGQGVGIAAKILATPAAKGVRFESYQNQVHVFQMLAGLSRRHIGHTALSRLYSFITSVVAAPPSSSAADPVSFRSQFFEVDVSGEAKDVGDEYFRRRLGAMCAKVRMYKGAKDPEKKVGLVTADRHVRRAPAIWEGVRLEWYEEVSGAGAGGTAPVAEAKL